MLAMIAPDGLVVWVASNAGASRAAAIRGDRTRRIAAWL
jgi:hypothetical protein